MGVTKNHLIYDLKMMARAGRDSDDESLTSELIGFWVDNTRAELIGQWVDKGRSLNPDIIQTLPCVSVIQVDASECGCEEVDCLVFRTELQIPATVESAQGNNLITRVGPVKINAPAFSFIPYERAIWTGGSKWTANRPKAFLRNGYIYILSTTYIGTVITISLVASYPEDLENFSTCAGEACYTRDSAYPISARMIETLKKKIVEADFKVALQTKGDDVNNANNII